VDGAPASKPAFQVHAGQALAVTAPPRQYVSRGGHKLAHGLDTFGVEPAGRHALDAGVSTGGFTDCLLQRGVASVVAVDVGYGQVHDRIRSDARVTVMERTNIRALTPADLPGPPIDLVVCDLSFIALQTVLPTLRELASADEAEAVVLVKPQFEAGRDQVGKGGVVRDPEVWRAVLSDIIVAAAQAWPVVGLTASPLRGPAGNVEFLAHLVPMNAGPHPDAAALVEAAVAEGREVRGGQARESPGTQQ